MISIKQKNKKNRKAEQMVSEILLIFLHEAVTIYFEYLST